MKKTSTTTIIGFTTVILCFIILILTLTGLVHSSETMQTQIVQLTSSILILVLGFYFGATHKQNEPQTPKAPMKQVFWDIQSLEDDLVDIHGIPVTTPYPVKLLPTQDSSYEILQDNTGVGVLVVTTTTPITLGLSNAQGNYQSTSVVADFAGGRPIRK